MERREFLCKACNLTFSYKSKLQRHLKSSKHKLYLARQEALQSLEFGSRPSPRTACHYCYTGREIASVARCTPPNTTMSCTWSESEAESEETDSENEQEGVGLEAGASSCTSIWEEQAMSVYVLGTRSEQFEFRGLATDFSPFPSKSFALAYLLANSLHPVSESFMKYVCFGMYQLDATTPSLYHLKSFVLPGLVPPTEVESTTGVPFYMHKPSQLLQKCLGDPAIATKLHRYPVKSLGVISEVYEANRWINSAQYQAPMITHDACHIYVGDVVVYRSDSLPSVSQGKVSKFFVQKSTNQMMVEMTHTMTKHDATCGLLRWTLNPSLRVTIPKHRILAGVAPQFTRESIYLPNGEAVSDNVWHDLISDQIQLKMRAGGRQIVMVPLILYTDDTSGNRTKKWNKFDLWCMLLGGLPRKENTQFSNIHFICCSNRATALEMSETLSQDLLTLETEGLVTYDAHLKEEVLVISPVLCIICDNPRASELTNHLGNSARKYCRMCLADKFTSPHTIGPTRTKENSLSCIRDIDSAATNKQKMTLQTEFGLRGCPSPLLTLSFDLYQSTPVECLHTILLGPYKYLTGELMNRLNAEDKRKILAKIDAFDITALHVHLTGNITRNHQSFFGRDFKAWAQMCIFITWEFLTVAEREVWLALSKVFKVAYVDNFHMDDLPHIDEACQGFVSSIVRHKPEWLMKPKVHLLLHLSQCLREFGPTSAFNTERCESFNSIIRSYNVYSNHQAPSRDIANRFGRVSHLLHMCNTKTSTDEERYIFSIRLRSGNDFKHLLNQKEVKRLMYGVTEHIHGDSEVDGHEDHGVLRKKIGDVASLRYVSVTTVKHFSTLAGHLQDTSHFLILGDHLSLDDHIIQYGTVLVNAEGKTRRVPTNSYVSFRTSVMGNSVEHGKLLASFTLASEHNGYSLIQLMEAIKVGEDPIVNEQSCPLIQSTTIIIAISSKDIISPISIVHQCTSSCKFIYGNATSFIERKATNSTKLIFKHNFTNDIYCLNPFCMK